MTARATRSMRRTLSVAVAAGLLLVGALAGSVPSASAGVSSSYPNAVFSDGFESGSLAQWAGNGGTGSATVVAAAAHTGSYGLRMTNTSGQYDVVPMALSTPLVDSSVTFWVRVGSAAGVQSVAQARNQASNASEWALQYDGSNQGFWFYPYQGATSTAIYTGNNSAPLNTWVQVEVRFTATTTGGAEILLNGQTQSGWSVTGDYSATNPLARLQLWDDVANTTDFDDVSIATPAPTAPGAPSAVAGTPANGSVALTWAAPASDGGSPVTGYQITPYVGTTAQTAVLTKSAGTSYTVTGLTNGTAYTFTVAAVNAAGTGPPSAASAPVTPTVPAATLPGAPTGLTAGAGNGSAVLAWIAPASNGGSAITGYSVTPYVGTSAQPAVLTNSTAAGYTVTGLTNGTAYTFTVAAINGVGTGPASAPSRAVTPVAMGVSPSYPNVVFSDGFESGSLAQWAGNGGTGSATVVAAAAHAGSYGLRMSNTSGQYDVVPTTLSTPLVDSSVTFWVRVGSAAGVQSVAQARNQASNASEWAIMYDGNNQGFWFYPYQGATSTAIYTGNNSAPLNTWVQVEVRFTATTTGGAEILLNGQTQPGWSVAGDYSATNPLARLQLWDDVANTTDFDDVRIATPPPTAPGAPTAVTGSPANGSVALTWTAPASDGGSPITGYQITPYAGTTAQTAVLTKSAGTSYTVTGLTNGTAYTFTVAAINTVGTGPPSGASAPVTPAVPVASLPGAPTGVTATPANSGAILSWTAPASNGGNAVTDYRITPHTGTTALTPVLTQSAATTYTVNGLTNGTAYTFTVAAINGVGAGPDSAPSPSVTPAPVGVSPSYPNVIFADGFESGSLALWAGAAGTGSANVVAAAAHSGSYGLRMSNTSGQYEVVSDVLSSALVDSSVSFWVRVNSTAGVQSVAEVRNQASNQSEWAILYDGSNQGFWFYPSNGTSSTPIYTGNNSAPLNTWVKVEVRFTATTTGGAEILLNGQTQPGWSLTGDYSGANPVARLQLWDDVANSTDFDDVAIASPGSSGPATAPGAPTGVAGAPANGSVSLVWTPPASNGNSAITGYQITPYVGTTAQSSIPTNSAAPSYTVTGLTNGTAYTFTVAAINSAGTGPPSAASAPVTPAVLNAVQTENLLPGDPTWGDFSGAADETLVSGYGSKISLNHGDSIDLYVTTKASSVSIDIYRMGWYGGVGARHMLSMGSFPGVNQPQATPDPQLGMVSENWSKTATLNVPSSWVTGVYLAKLTASNGYKNFIFFVVRDDGGHEAINFQTSVNTYQAYNTYGGTSLYSNNTNGAIYSAPHAMKVSFDRPFDQGSGAGQFLWYEYPTLRWMESQGYDISYTTDVDTDANVNPLTNHKAFLAVGHDEYWSMGMRNNVDAAIASKVNVGFFAGNESFWQVRYESDAAGVADRVMVGYKDYADYNPDCVGSCAWPGPDPMWNVNPAVLTSTWRDPAGPNAPEEEMMGEMYGGEASGSYVVENASNWVYAGTGWTNGTAIPGIVGYEYDHYFGDATTPKNVTVLSSSPIVNSNGDNADGVGPGGTDTANSTIYTAPSGARVFEAGTIEWGYGLDNYGGTTYVNAGIQRVTRNILANFTGS